MGVLEGCDRFLKYIFFFFTFVLWIIGLAALIIGIWAVVDDKFTDFVKLKIPDLNANDLKKAATLLIVVGVGIMIIGFLGCCGAMKENQCFLGLFFILLFLIFCLMIGGAVLAYGYKDVLEDLVRKGLVQMKEHYNDAKNPTKDALDLIQQNYKCCEWKNKTEAPDSCYEPVPTPAPSATADKRDVADAAASSAAPSGAKTAAPTAVPTAVPTAGPTVPIAPTEAPTQAPTEAPAVVTTGAPAVVTTEGPTVAPSVAPTKTLYTKDCAEEIIKKMEEALDGYKLKIAGIGVASAIIVVLGMVVSMALCCKIRRGYANV